MYTDTPRTLDFTKTNVPFQSRFKILYPLDYLPTSNEAQTSAIHRFINGLEKSLAAKRTKISLAGQWAKDLPDGDDNADLAEYLRLVRISAHPSGTLPK